MNILVFSPDPAKLRIISFALESRLGINVMQAERIETAFEHLLAEDAVDLLVISDTPSTPLFIKYLASLHSKIPVILVNTAPARRDVQYPGINIAAQLNVDTLLQDLPALIHANYRVGGAVGTDAEYCRISVELLLRVSPLQADVYVRLSSVKLVKMFNAGTTFTEDDLSRVWGVKRLDYLYIKKDASAPFVKKLQAELTQMARKAHEGDDSLLATVAHVQETIQGLAQRTGITEEVIKLTNVHVDFALKVIGRTPQLKRVMSTVLSNKGGYVANHSVQVAHMACCIASELKWPSNLTFQKLIFAAFIHDLLLPDPDHALVSTKQELLSLKGALAPEEYAKIELHPLQGSEVVNRFSQIPSDVGQIILQHHELPLGDGFPRGLTASKIAPLSAVFIVAHQIIDEVHRTGQSFDFQTFWASKEHAYVAGTFREILRAYAPAMVQPAA